MANLAQADLLGVNPSYPQINFVNVDTAAVSYDPVSQIFSVNGLPYGITLSSVDPGAAIVGTNTMQIQFATDGTSTNVFGTNGFILTGLVTVVQGGVSNTYSGTLLQGDVIGFGYQYLGPVNEFDFRIQLTGGLIQSLFDCENTFAITMTSEASSFTGSFTTNFNGRAKGYCGPEDTIPPSVTCPPLSQVVTTPATDPNNPTNQGFIITYPNPIVTDNCDPDPTIYCDTPSGSFVALPPGAPLTVNCYGIDVSGNSSSCSFTVIMGQQNVCSIGFTNPCTPVTLPADMGSCSATYVFPLPLATNCSGQTFVATATALNELGAAITLTTLSNGLVQGVFPKTITTNGNTITFTASDGQGDTVVEQCQVFVKDTQAPEIMCLNQSATFKPILTNALSCIQATFNNPCIPASNYLWFSSVIKPVSSRNQIGNFTVHVFNQTIQLAVDNTNITLSVPDAYIYFSNGLAVATTIFTNNQWVTYSSLGCSGNTFASGLAWQLPFNLNNVAGGCWGRDQNSSFYRRHINSATWCARFAVDTAGISLNWQWGAVVEGQLTTNYNGLCVKPVDDHYSSSCKNNDPAGSCENYKSYLCPGGRGQGNGFNGQPDCTGILSSIEPCNLGKGIVCEGPVYFTTPIATDNCDDSVLVTCTPPSGSIFGPGTQTITCTAVDSSGNSNQCSFTLTVLPPVQVVFDSPACDNIADNTADPDLGYNDMNCPDDPSTPEYITCFHVGDKITHVCRLLDCNGNDVTSTLAPCVTVHIDVTERQGSYSDSILVNDLTQNQSTGTPGCIMVPGNGNFQYTLNTAGCPAGTVNTSTFFRSCVWVDYNTSPGVPIGMEDVLLQSR